MINCLRINNFRNYAYAKLDIPRAFKVVVLYGENGEGKTNILEAISLFFKPNGFRKAKYEDMINQNSDQKHWSITAEMNDITFSSGYVLNNSLGRRIYKIDDKLTKNPEGFQKNNYVLWMTYETDRLFLQSPSDRRAFIDMFCSVRNRNHTQNVRDYEKLIKERLKILKKYYDKEINEDVSTWLTIIENKISSLGIKVATERIGITDELEKYQLSNNVFFKFSNKMDGGLEAVILKNDRDSQSEVYLNELLNRRQKDYFSNSTTFGANRSDWIVFHEEKQISVEHCSAGEQKILLMGIFLSFVVKNIERDNRNLILLLDDVMAHLDHMHKLLFFKYVKDFIKDNDRVSVWISGTDKNLFDELREVSAFFKIFGGKAFLE
ncbi:MAG: AAA family ATPase [Holosporales bacterium]|jgi:DNA replication and repair protein RecF|nr:AAA family ATPase [Holosporales bacterium]